MDDQWQRGEAPNQPRYRIEAEPAALIALSGPGPATMLA
jgi:hypothetical protein